MTWSFCGEFVKLYVKNRQGVGEEKMLLCQGKIFVSFPSHWPSHPDSSLKIPGSEGRYKA